MAAMILVLGACGDDDAASISSDDIAQGSNAEGTSRGGRAVVDPQPPGQAMVMVDGQEYTLTDPGAIACTIDQDAITFSFRIGDNEVTLGGGANLHDNGWLGGMDLRVANPAGEPGPISYSPDLAAHGDGIVVDGVSMSYSGPMRKQPANDGSNPPPIDVGDGTISVTCG